MDTIHILERIAGELRAIISKLARQSNGQYCAELSTYSVIAGIIDKIIEEKRRG